MASFSLLSVSDTSWKFDNLQKKFIISTDLQLSHTRDTCRLTWVLSFMCVAINLYQKNHKMIAFWMQLNAVQYKFHTIREAIWKATPFVSQQVGFSSIVFFFCVVR